MSKHTPGPWQVSEKRKNLVIGPRGHALADCKFSHSLTNRQLPTASECIANARLIAAAPDLLRALVDLGDWLAYGLNKAEGAEPTAEDHAAWKRIAKQARAAIAKATGERS